MRRRAAFIPLAALSALVILLPTRECQAGGLIPITFDQTQPFIAATDGSLSYNASTGDFNVQATGLFYLSNDLPGERFQVPLDGGQATIDLTLDQNGNLLGPGTLTVTGGIDFDQDGTDDATGTLLTGSVTAFGAAGPGPAPWEFDGLFNVTGGGPEPGVDPPERRRHVQQPVQLGGARGIRPGRRAAGQRHPGGLRVGLLGEHVKNLPAGQAIPEPSSGALGTIALAGVAGWWRWRLRTGRSTRRTPVSLKSSVGDTPRPRRDPRNLGTRGPAQDGIPIQSMPGQSVPRPHLDRPDRHPGSRRRGMRDVAPRFEPALPALMS